MNRLYKVFLVEDEIVTRQGIRNSIDWASEGFEFCGEAPDGEMALPMILACKPDLLITDIKMPFMDGLQLCRIVRDHLPEIKIIILSGHDEFNYAQEAIRLRVTEYLLKPISAMDVVAVLRKVAKKIECENQVLEDIEGLKTQVEDHQEVLKEHFLLKLILGSIPANEIIDKSQQFKLDIIARAYQVMVIKPELSSGGRQNDEGLKQVDINITRLIKERTDVILCRKGLEEIIFILKGDSTAQVEQYSYFLARLLKNEVENKIECLLTIGIGLPKERLGDIAQSYREAVENSCHDLGQIGASHSTVSIDPAELQKLNSAAFEQYLKTGVMAELGTFYDQTIAPLEHTLLASQMLLHYYFLDLLITASRFVDKLGGNPPDVLPQLRRPEVLISRITSPEQIKEQTCRVLLDALRFRDKHAGQQYDAMLEQAKAYIGMHFMDSDISLNAVASHVNLSVSHFSVLFGRETGETFVEYLTRVRIEKAKELLRTTNLNANEISYEVGYNNPRYFYSVFKKVSGCSPSEFRLKAQTAILP
ncbi:MAG: response regulator [Anaerolineae bacterium]|nr:response regulator [Anaerolineae bacterium]